MTETIDSDPYINTFLTERPKDGMDRIQSRLRAALKLNDEMADYFKERALVEDTYAKNLAKLNKKVFITDKHALGNLRPTWDRLQNELTGTSAIHATFATKILDDLEKALRSAIITDQDYADIRSMDPALQKLAKEYDERQGKLAKQKKALEKNGKKPLDIEAKYTEAKKQLDVTKLDWQQSATSYIQKFQAVDERRWSDIKSYLLQFETVHVDQMLKRVQLARDNLASVSQFSVENEIKSSYGERAITNNSSTSIPSTMLPLDSAMSSESCPPTNTSQMNHSPSPPSLLIDISDDPIHPQSTVSTASFTSTQTKQTRQTRQTSIPPSSSASEGVYSEQSDIRSQRRGSDSPSITPSKKSDKQRKFLSTLSIRLKSKSSGNNRSNQNHLDLPDFTTEKAHSFMDNASVYSVQEEGEPSEATKQMDQQSSVSSSTLQTPPTLRKITSFSDSFFNQPSSPQSQQQQPSTPNILIDDEGFSIPPPDRSPWTTTDTMPTSSSSSGDDQQDARDLASMDSASLHGSLPPPRFKLDIKTDSVVQEDATSSQVALTRVASMLKESNPTNTTKRSRGRRELRSQLFLQGNSLSPGYTTTTTIIPPPPACASSTVTLGDHLITPATSDDPTTVNNLSHHETTVSPFAHDDDDNDDDDDNGNEKQQQQVSIVKQPSLSITPTPPTKQQPAISVKITETVHAQLQQGQAQRIMVTGQVALLYQGQEDTPTTPLRFLIKHNGTETTFMADSIQRMEETDQGVVYQWTPPSASTLPTETDQQQQGDNYIACLQYRQRQDEPSSSGLVVPLLVKPMWKCDGDQARLIIKYSKTTTAASKALDQVMMVTHVGGECQGAQSMPTGQWMVDQQRMMWSLVDSITGLQDDEEQVIRAKFATTSQAAPQPIAVRFEMQHQLVSSLQVVEHATPITTTTTTNPWARIIKVDKCTKSGKYIAEV